VANGPLLCPKGETLVKKRLLLIFVLVFTLPALACSLFQTQDLDATATFVAGEIFATMTAEVPTVTPTPTITITPTPTDTPTPTYTATVTPTETDTPTPVHVAADGSGDYPSLEEALAAVPPESTILLDPGTYRLKHKLEIDKTISLRGAGMDQTIVVGNDATYVIRFTGPGKFTLQGITLRYEGTPWANVVSVKDGDIDFSDCSFTGGVFDGNEKKGGAGLITRGNTSGEIADCRSEDNGNVGFNLRDDSVLTLERNTCSNNSWVGIVYWQNSGGLAKENSCLNNGFNGIAVEGQAQPTLEGNTCQGHTYTGISFGDNSRGVVRENQIMQNGLHGIRLGGNASPTLERNIIKDNQANGIRFDDNSRGVVRENQIMQNGLDGILLKGDAAPTLESNIIKDNQKNGIRFDDNSRGVVRENQIMQNGRHGIELGGDAAPILERNIIEDNQENGIAYFGNAGGTARQNEISGNLECITVEEDANPELINNSCDGSVTSDPTFGPITFARDMSEDRQPINPMTEFPRGVTRIFGVFEFQGMSDGWDCSPIFFRNGEEYASNSWEWEQGVNGITFTDLFYPDGKSLESGNYELKLFVGDKLIQSGKFRIGQ